MQTTKTAQAQEIRRALLQDQSNTQIAREFGVHKETVVGWRRRFGIPRFVPREHCWRTILKILRSDTAATGVYLTELVSACGASRQKLYWILKDMEEAGLVFAMGQTNARRWYASRKRGEPCCKGGT